MMMVVMLVLLLFFKGDRFRSNRPGNVSRLLLQAWILEGCAVDF